jgi:hypothetical protein
LSVFDIVKRNLPRASDVMIASPWISEKAVEPLLPMLKPKNTTVISYPSSLQRDDGPETLRSVGAKIFSGPVHAKLYLLRDKGVPFMAVFGSENFTRANNEELVLASTDLSLNSHLVRTFGQFLSRCSKA